MASTTVTDNYGHRLTFKTSGPSTDITIVGGGREWHFNATKRAELMQAWCEAELDAEANTAQAVSGG